MRTTTSGAASAPVFGRLKPNCISASSIRTVSIDRRIVCVARVTARERKFYGAGGAMMATSMSDVRRQACAVGFAAVVFAAVLRAAGLRAAVFFAAVLRIAGFAAVLRAAGFAAALRTAGFAAVLRAGFAAVLRAAGFAAVLRAVVLRAVVLRAVVVAIWSLLTS